MNASQVTTSASGSGKRGLIITLIIFFIPFGAAAFLHLTGAYKDMGTSNRGTLIIPPVDTSELLLTDTKSQVPVKFEGRWHILYALPEACEAACRNTLTMIHQIKAALGPLGERVDLVAVLPDGRAPEDVSIAGDIRLLAGSGIPQAIFDKARQTIAPGKVGTVQLPPEGQRGQSTDRIYLIDTMGMIFMYHDTYADEKISLLKGKDLLRDIQHALKLSKIG